jgi:hypothetical protein
MWEATLEAEVKSTSPTKRCPDFLVESDYSEFLKKVGANQRTGDVIGTDINDNSTRFEPGTLNELGLPDSGDEDVGFFDLNGR